VFEMSAALAYYSALSLAPLVVITLGLAGLLVDRDVLQTHLVMEADAVLGHGTAELVSKLASEQRESNSGTVATVGGVVALALGALAVFGQLQGGLSRIFEGQPRVRSHGILRFMRRRLVSLAMVACVGFLLLVSLVASAVLSALAERLAVSATEQALSTAAQLLASIVVTTLLFALVFKLLPDAKVGWREAWAGAAFTAVLFHIGEWAIGRYLGRASVGSPYGAAGTLVVMLVWVYYSSLIVFAGAQFTHVVTTRHQPKEMVKEAREVRVKSAKRRAIKANSLK
jgi:membrane protein